MTILICLSVGWMLFGCEEKEIETKSLRMGELNMTMPKAPYPMASLPHCPSAPSVNLGVSAPQIGNSGILTLPTPEMDIGRLSEMNAVREVPVEVGE